MTDPFARGDDALHHAVKCWAKAADGGRSYERDGLLLTFADSPMRAYNQVFILDPVVSADALRAAAAEYVPGRFRVRFAAHLADALGDTPERAGLQLQGGIPSMALTLPVEPIGPPAELVIRRADDARTLLDHCAVVAAGFDRWAEELTPVFTEKLLSDPDFAAFVGYVNGEPVVTAQLVVHEGVAGLYWIATVESARGHGYGEAITRHAAAEGQARGCDIATLQASPMGRPLYERTGFTVIGDYVTYVPADAALDP